MTKSTDPNRRPALDTEMWTRRWMAENFDDLGPLGQKFASRLLLRGATLQEATIHFVADAIEAQIPWDKLTDFEQCLDRQCNEAHARWKKREGHGTRSQK